MKAVWDYMKGWLSRPQRTRADDLYIAVVAAALLWVIAWVGGKILDAAGLISFHNHVPIWATALIGGAALALGSWIGRRVYLLTPQVQELYSEHLDDALGDLRSVIDGRYPNFSMRDYIENGVFQPAQKLLMTRGRNRGEVRFSILHPSDKDKTVFRMQNDAGDLFPALGHTMEGRQRFDIAVDGSFSGYAFRTGKTQISNDVAKDERWQKHPRADPNRSYGSMISVPLFFDEGNPDGVLNVIATRTNAFDRTDQTYVGLLGAMIDVVRAAVHALTDDKDANP